MTALHPAGSDEEGQPRKDLWPPPESSADPISDNRDPLVKMLMQIAATQDAILEDHYFAFSEPSWAAQLFRLLLKDSSSS